MSADKNAYKAADGTSLTYEQILQRYFEAGAVRPAFGGRDLILGFDPDEYVVTARAVDADGQPLSGFEGRIRTHGTLPAPGSRELNEFLRAGGIEPIREAERKVFRQQLGLGLEIDAGASGKAPGTTGHAQPEASDEKSADLAPGSKYARDVASVIIDQLRRGTAPWTKPWAPGQVSARPYNPTTGKEYRGGNALWLMAQGMDRGYSDTRWMTFRQAQEQGASVHKGEKGTRIQYWMWSGDEPVPDEKTGRPKTDETGAVVLQRVQYERPRVFTAVVFNAEQIDGLPPPEKRAAPPEWERHQRAEGILTTSGATIRHLPGDRAYYNIVTDVIVLPDREQFAAGDLYYGTALHELAHWTGEASRLDRDLKGSFGTEEYAREELRAEIASFMLGDRLGIGHDPANHASYVANWIKSLEEDPREIFRAAGDAEKITDFIQQFDRSVEKATVSEHLSATQTTEHKSEGAVEHGDQPIPVLSQPEVPMANDQRTNLTVPYAERAAAKAAGARWDRDAKVWYAPEGSELAPLARWIPPAQERNPSPTAEPASTERTYLAVAYKQKNEARELGAKWDKNVRSWFVPPGVDATPFAQWMPRPHESVKAQDPFAEFGQAVEAAGLNLGKEPPRMDGQWHRVAVEGDKPGEKSGAYRGYLDGHPAGYIENHKAGERFTWKSDQPGPTLTEAERARLQAETAQRRADRDAAKERQHTAAAATALQKWEHAAPAPEEHPYLQKKGVPAHGVRVDEAGRLLVPLHDTASGRLVSLQSIGPDGRKSFEKGGRVTGASFRIEPPDPVRAGGGSKTLVVAEGYATAATVARALKLPTHVAFNASNLAHVATELRKQHPDAMICIAADNDHRAAELGRKNVGREKAEGAAKTVGGHVLLPEFGPGEKGTDWNDVEVKVGTAAVRASLEERLAAASLLDQARREVAAPAPAGIVRTAARKREAIAPPPARDVREQGSLDGR